AFCHPEKATRRPERVKLRPTRGTTPPPPVLRARPGRVAWLVLPVLPLGRSEGLTPGAMFQGLAA
ncbi:unnamed protein product, partial [Amoebophrya sp. A120]